MHHKGRYVALKAMDRDQNKLPIQVSKQSLGTAPALIQAAGQRATRRFYEFFTANIRNWNTRVAYHRALVDFFAWCDGRKLSLDDLEPIVIAAYVEYMVTIYSKPASGSHSNVP